MHSRWSQETEMPMKETHFSGPVRRLVVSSPLILQHRDLILVVQMNDYHRLDNLLFVRQSKSIFLGLTVDNPARRTRGSKDAMRYCFGAGHHFGLLYGRVKRERESKKMFRGWDKVEETYQAIPLKRSVTKGKLKSV